MLNINEYFYNTNFTSFFTRKVTHAWKDIESLILLGNADVPRLPIFSFVVCHRESGLLLHHNFIATILNDVFGIQARGGCGCAGPYALDLLGIDENLARRIESTIAEDRYVLSNLCR